MDPICHTLVGGALAQSGLKRRTAFGTAALLVGANLPDADALAYAWSPLVALEFRRGWTHGVLAMVVWPLLLTAVLLAWARIRHGRYRATGEPVRPLQVLLLSAIAILSHPLLDLLNTYGLRWLMPFSGRWFYGDALFIVDPWVWLALAAGIALSLWREHRTGAPAPAFARLALAALTLYAGVMATVGWATRRAVAGEYTRETGVRGPLVVASPVPVNPFARDVVVTGADQYMTGSYDWRRPERWEAERTYPLPGMSADDPTVWTAAETADGRRFLGWSRLPTFQLEHGLDSMRVHLIDLRYAREPDARFGTLTVALPSRRAQRPDPLDSTILAR